MDSLWLIPTLPLLGFLLLVVTEGRLPKLPVALIGAGSVGAAAAVTLMVALDFLQGSQAPFSQTLWTWMQIGEFAPRITLALDGLSLVMLGVITGVGFLIHVYATGYMAGEAGYSRFFAYMNLFVFAMLMLVLGDNLLVLYFGWEGVGSVQLSADRLSSRRSRERLRRAQGFRRDASGRRRARARPVPAVPGTRHAGDCEGVGRCAAGVARWLARLHHHRAAAVGRRRGQVGATAAADRGCPTRWPAPRRYPR